MLFKSDPPPSFASTSASVKRVVTKQQFETVFAVALAAPELLSARETIALELFNASFFQVSADARFLMLVMSIEALLDAEPLSEPAVVHVKKLLTLTRESTELLPAEKQSLMGRLEWLKRESIRQSGLRYIKRLSGREYMGYPAAKFFDYCYKLRSALTHGSCPLPAQSDVGRAAANLEVLVSDLLAGNLRDVDANAAAPD